MSDAQKLSAHIVCRIARDLRAADYGVVSSHGVTIRKAAAAMSRDFAYWVNGAVYTSALKAASMAVRS